MKKIILSSIIILASILTYAGDKDYFKTMEKNVKELEKAEKVAEFRSLAENFIAISEENTDQWLPLYYVAYCYLNTVFSEEGTENTDMVLDKAEAYIDKARELSPENDEIEVLQGWIYQGRIIVDPIMRGQVYSQKASASFGKARNINPENPRIYFLTGQNVMYTPEMFGGGKEAACPYFIEAAEKFKTFKPESRISPDWGREYNREIAESCEK
ncbi:MAG: hypothetical protein V2I47_09025 [Bacteroidales bacterium]|jgi:tetratricopeptide (TPR) repeat protein|nr:hypothetical protein [Bacteroidales bacterium]